MLYDLRETLSVGIVLVHVYVEFYVSSLVDLSAKAQDRVIHNE